ncbi:hypothetical protein KTS45_13920 [Halomicroarcula limicola]|uniref:HTH iclR-type domain-containing protein n=1 Tax=Haloarcula limicola TaxID=1429915 RepID=A0A8J7YF27_9EURY|nr:hypothetical protein [Halomicroarcula limicola]MBV0925298.1 hypothetical protein [Halomicroarcula limicola]
MVPRAPAVFLVLLVVASVATPVAASVVAPTRPAQQTTPTETPTPVTENTTFYVQIQPNGDARWTVTDTYALEDQNDTDAFESLAQEYVDGETDTRWEAAFREANERATAATGREMNITGMSRDYVVNERRGTLILEFTWTDFATVERGRLVVGDAFETPEGTWFRSLGENQRLVISAPAGYGVQNSPPRTAVIDGELRFEGPRTFEPDYLEIVYTGNPDRSPTDTPERPAGLFGNVPFWFGAVLMLVVGLVVAVGYINWQGNLDLPPAGASGTDTGGGDGGGAAGAVASGVATDGADESGAAAASDDGDEETDVTLLSDEERVERLLDRNGGRMKQARIVKETGWSNAKVSQLLSAMDEDGRIDKLRIGRENLISFPDEDVTEIDE